MGDRRISWCDCAKEGESEELMDIELILEKGVLET